MAELKILMTNTVDDHLLAPQYFAGLQNMLANVSGTYYLDQLNSQLAQSFIAKVLYRVYPEALYATLNQTLLQDVDAHQPDLVWIFKGMEIWPKTLAQIKSKGVKLVNYNPDHPFRHISKGSGNKNVLRSIELYDLHLSYSQHIIQELQQHYKGINTFYLPFGYPDHVEQLSFDESEIKRVCFIGNGDTERAKIIQYAAQTGLEIDVYGPQWNKHLTGRQKGIHIYPPVYGKEYWSKLRQYRVQLNILRAHNIHSHNMRSFEIPAVGGIMLTDYSVEHLEFFEENREAFYFTSAAELVEKAKALLQLDSVEADTIRTQAQTRTRTSAYRYSDRSKLVINEFNRLLYG